MRFVKNNSFGSGAYNFIVYYPAPFNISYFWNFGFLAGICLVVQILTGFFLAMHYNPSVELAFVSVEHIMRDVAYGWLVRYLHANGASMFFAVVYLHMFRSLYYGSYIYPRGSLWVSGVVILLLMIVSAFLGYVLPWGQMSYWAATVITNLFSAIPYVGDIIVQHLWGGFSVGNATLNRFFSLHFLCPFLLLGVVIVHVILLHEYGSNNPLGVPTNTSLLPFAPYLNVKELVSVLVFLFVFSWFVYFQPNDLGHTDNYIPGDPLVTPEHIVPEWYFLPFYAILRSVPDKLMGVIFLASAIITLLFVPLLGHARIRSSSFRPFYKFFFWVFAVTCLILGWVGGLPVASPYLELGQVATFFYFFYFLVLMPLICLFERRVLVIKRKLVYRVSAYFGSTRSRFAGFLDRI